MKLELIIALDNSLLMIMALTSGGNIGVGNISTFNKKSGERYFESIAAPVLGSNLNLHNNTGTLLTLTLPLPHHLIIDRHH